MLGNEPLYHNDGDSSYYSRSIGGNSGSSSSYRDKLTITENKLASTNNLINGANGTSAIIGGGHHMMFSSLDPNAHRYNSDQLYMKVGDMPHNNWQRTHSSCTSGAKLLKDPDIIYAPNAINRNVISFLNKKDFRDDV